MSSEPVIHPTALCDGAAIGAGSRVEAFATVDPSAVVGQRCTIGQSASVGPGVTLGDGARVHAGARLVANVTLAEGVVIFENAVLGGDAPTAIGRDASIGANATIRAGAGVGQGAVIEPGAVVADPVPANAVVSGDRALIVGYVANDPAPGPDVPPSVDVLTHVEDTRVPGVRLHPITSVTDMRGNLVAADFSEVPFVPQRVFAVFGVSSEFIRGSHAHRRCEQFLICVTGSIRCLVDDGDARDEVSLDEAHRGLHMPAMIWGTQYKYTRDALLLVLASEPYDADDYIRDYDEFLRLAGRG